MDRAWKAAFVWFGLGVAAATPFGAVLGVLCAFAGIMLYGPLAYALWAAGVEAPPPQTVLLGLWSVLLIALGVGVGVAWRRGDHDAVDAGLAGTVTLIGIYAVSTIALQTMKVGWP